MITIGKIVHTSQLINHKPLPYVFYQDLNVTSKDDKSLPTLIIGWKLVNKLFDKYEHDILEKEIHVKSKSKLWWEFSAEEDIIQYTNGVEHFIKKIPYNFLSQYEYRNADPIFNNLFELGDLDKFLPNGGYLYTYKNEIAYYLFGNTIYGIKLTMYDYVGVKIGLVIDTLINKSAKYFIDDSSEYQKYYKLFPEFSFLKRSMVVFLFS